MSFYHFQRIFTLFKEISGTDEIEVAACGVPVKNKASAAPLANEDELDLEDSSICSSQSFNSKSTSTAQNNNIIEVKAVSEAPAANVVPESKVVVAEQQKPKEVFSLIRITKYQQRFCFEKIQIHILGITRLERLES